MRESSMVQSWIAEGEAKERAEIALRMIKGGESAQKIAAYTSLSLDQIQQLQEEITEA